MLSQVKLAELAGIVPGNISSKIVDTLNSKLDLIESLHNFKYRAVNSIFYRLFCVQAGSLFGHFYLT